MLMMTTCLIWQGQAGAQAHSAVAGSTVGVKVGEAVTVVVGSGEGRARVDEGIGVLVIAGGGTRLASEVGDAGARVAGIGALAAPPTQPANQVRMNSAIMLKIA